MQALTVLYDGGCAFCARCAEWLASSPQIVPLTLLDVRDRALPDGYRRIPGAGDELVAVDDRGNYWIGPAAFVMALWALDRWRGVASMLLWSPLLPITRAAFTFLSARRATFGQLVGTQACTEHCGAPSRHAQAPYR